MGLNEVLFGDCRDTMRQLITDGVKVQMCVTSPPYFGLRDYGHEAQLGLEVTPGEYVANMVEVFSLVRELLNDDGVLWLNLGDTYAAGSNKPLPKHSSDNAGRACKPAGCLKPKNLIGIPWRVAFALQEDGWYLRQDIIWHKPNVMPESVTDRCVKAHEYIFLLSKNAKYYFDNGAIKEPHTTTPGRQRDMRNEGYGEAFLTPLGKGKRTGYGENGRNKRSVWTVHTKPFSGAHFAAFPTALIEPCILAGSKAGDIVLDPFFGSGTTGEVSQKHGRKWIGCEINTDYADIQRERVGQESIWG